MWIIPDSGLREEGNEPVSVLEVEKLHAEVKWVLPVLITARKNKCTRENCPSRRLSDISLCLRFREEETVSEAD